MKQLLSVADEITKCKQAEEALRRERDLVDRIMNTSPAGITFVDAHGRVVYANQRAEKILGIELSEAAERSYNDPGWKITDFKGNAFPEESLPFYIVKRTNQSVYDVQHAIEKPDGSRVLLSINATPIFNAAGAFDGMVTTIEDITDKFEAEQNFQMLFREMLDGFALHEIIYDYDGHPIDYRFLAVNPAFERLTGLSGELLIGKTVLEVMPKTEAYWIEKYGRVALTGEPDTFENYSQEIGRHFQVTAFRYAKNQFACIFVDITERKRADEERIKLQMQLSNAVEIAHLGHWEYDVKKDLFTFSDQFYKIFRTTAGEIGGYTMSSAEYAQRFVHPDDRPVVGKAIQKAIQTADPNFKGQLEHRMVYADGSIGYISVLFFIVKGADGNTVKTYGVNQDITERKKIEERLRQAQKMEAIGNLAGGIAHDFNNILSPIVGMSELLLEDLRSGSPEHQSAREIFDAGIRAGDLVKQILTFSRQTEHKMMPVSVQSILKEVLKLARSTIPSNIKIVQNIQTDSCLVNADPTQLHQVAMNLITNAFHAVETAGGEISVGLKEIRVARDDAANGTVEPGRYARLTVSDTGCGIASHLLDKIFEPYFTTKQQGKGTGLGLAVVYGILQEHQGVIRVHSELGKGTTFNVYLPLIDHPAEQAPAGTVHIHQTGTERILLVDDEEPIVRLEKKMLERLGYRITMCVSSLEALAVFKANPDAYDLVVTDMTMPNLTGDLLAKELISIRPDIPIIICTGFSERIDKEKAAAMGISAFLMKPVVKSEMVRMVRKLLDGAKGPAQK